jgi:hypothetical protein
VPPGAASPGGISSPASASGAADARPLAAADSRGAGLLPGDVLHPPHLPEVPPYSLYKPPTISPGIPSCRSSAAAVTCGTFLQPVGPDGGNFGGRAPRPLAGLPYPHFIPTSIPPDRPLCGPSDATATSGTFLQPSGVDGDTFGSIFGGDAGGPLPAAVDSLGANPLPGAPSSSSCSVACPPAAFEASSSEPGDQLAIRPIGPPVPPPAPDETINSAFPWLGPWGLRVVSWNINGFLHSVEGNIDRLNLQKNRVLGLTRRYNIVTLLETHGNEGHHHTLRSLLPFWGIFMSFHATPSAGGVIMLVHPDLMGKFGSVTPHIIEPGRAMVLDFSHLSYGLRVAAVHCDCRHRPVSRQRLWRSLDAWRTPPLTGLFLLIGDLNTIAAGDSRFYPATGTFSHMNDDMEDILHESLGKHLVEFAQDSYTRRGLDDGHFKVLSRIDRCFSNLDTLSAIDCKIKSGVEWPLASGYDPSDHVPVFVVIQAPSLRPSLPSVPLWVAQLPLFPEMVQTMLDYMPAATSVHQQVVLVKEAMYSAAIELRETSGQLGATSIAEKLYWATRALRALRRCDDALARKCCLAVPELRLAISDQEVCFQVIVEVVQAFSLTDLVTQIEEVEEDTELPPAEKSRRTAKLRRLSDAWGRTRRRLTLSSILGPEGLPILDDTEATAALHDAWAPTFGKTDFDQEGSDQLLLHAGPPLEVAPSPMNLEEFTSMVSRTGNSAPGPDGIVYAAWRLAPACCAKALHELYLDIFAGTPPPSGFNNTNMVFIPKPSGDPLETLCARAPGALRPISLANADNKVIAMAFARPLGDVASRWCSGDQFGFIAGRSIWDAVMLFEAAALHLSRRDADAGLLFIDFRAAFPSILHGWIRQALLATGLPETFVTAFLFLYIDVFAMICFGNGAASWLAMLSGIRQGCPASGAIFAICIDPLLRKICSWLPSPWSKLVAYADDIAIALRGARSCLVRLFILIEEAEACTGLCINVAKSTIVPLWTTDIAAATREVQSLDVRLAGLEVAAFFRHLGVLVGPGADPIRWAAALAKYLDRAVSIKGAGGGLCESIRMYGSLAVSTLQYIAQYCSPPASARKIEARAIARITSSPLYAFPVSLASGLDEIGLRPGVVHIEAMAIAAQLRALASSQHLPTILALTSVTADEIDDDAFLHDRWLEWRAVALTTGIRANIGRLHGSPALLAIRPGDGMQRRYYRVLLPATRSLHPSAVLRARLAHWGFDGPELDNATWFAELRLRQCAKLKLPATIFWSLLRIWCNALPTSRRFRNRQAVGACPFGCGAVGGDDIRHFALCPLVFTALLPIIGGANCWPNIASLRSLFLLEPRNCTHDVVLGAAIVDTVVNCFLFFRRSPPLGVEVVRNAFNERLCTLMQWSPRVRAAVVATRGGNLLLAPLLVAE